jgi:hydroxyethylthiazole kinase-like uncharacterized protein yjeF
MKALTASEMREVDRLTAERFAVPGTELMENAGAAVAETVSRLVSAGGLVVGRIVVLCGKGNNGGDGLVAARHLRPEFHHTAVILFAPPSELRGDAALNFKRWNDAGGDVLVADGESAWPAVCKRLSSADVILDALLGTGLRGPATGLMRKAIEELNAFSGSARSPVPALVVAVDTPSGLPSDGEPSDGPVVRAHRTVTFTAPKVGQLVSADASCCGELIVRQIGSPAPLVEELGRGVLRWGGPEEFARLPLLRPADSHKGLYGHVLVVAGSTGKSGAAVLAGMGALRAGAGLVTVSTPAPVQPVVASGQPEYMTEPLAVDADGSIAPGGLADPAAAELLRGKTVLAIGPGLGRLPGTERFIRTLVESTELPTVLDADGLNAFAGAGDRLGRRKSEFLAITPHPGEMARLLGVSTGEVQNDRSGAAREAARRWKAHVLLKGFHTILASPDGRLMVNTTGNPGLAKGGSGDVLTGVLAALTAQFGTSDWLRVLALAAWLHGCAADTLVEDADASGILATDVARALPYARRRLLEEIRRGE